jgi:hypothetical protein
LKQSEAIPRLRPGGIVTVSFLKAKLDEGADRLDIFSPLIADVIATITAESFVTTDVQSRLAARHGIDMPQHTVDTLIRRLVKRKHILREAGRYRRQPAFSVAADVTEMKSKIEKRQLELAAALREYAAGRGTAISSIAVALSILIRFLQDSQIPLLLGTPALVTSGPQPSRRETAVIAEFLQAEALPSSTLRSVIDGILEGLVLYQAAFLPDGDVSSRKFEDLKVFFDSVLVRQALGYEGEATKKMVREAIDVLKAQGVECLVFDVSVKEIRRILDTYETMLRTDYGRKSLRRYTMARFFLTQRYSTSDVREMNALLESEIRAIGLGVLVTPERIPRYVSAEKKLAERLSDPVRKDERGERVSHDVDCVAAILTLRRGHQTTALENARAVFTTSSYKVISNTREWYEQDEHGQGLEPIVHIRALANLAWLKRPRLSKSLKQHELIALCGAALRPRRSTWARFLHHLNAQRKSNKVTSDEMTAILVSELSDPLLREAETGSLNDPDAATMDEIIDRLKADYRADADAKVAVASQRAASEAARAAAAEQSAAEKERRRELAIASRSRKIGHATSVGAFSLVAVLAVVGAIQLLRVHPFRAGVAESVIEAALGGLAVVFILLELVGVLRHAAELRGWLERRITSAVRSWLTMD